MIKKMNFKKSPKNLYGSAPPYHRADRTEQTGTEFLISQLIATRLWRSLITLEDIAGKEVLRH